MIIRTSQELASIGCCDCQPPSSPAPRKECESKSATSTSADTDYSDALAEWEEKLDRFNTHEAWAAADPSTRGDEPPDEANPGDAPEPPEDWWDSSHGSWAPFISPEGSDPEDDLGSLYREMVATSEPKYSGSWGDWIAFTDYPPGYFDEPRDPAYDIFYSAAGETIATATDDGITAVSNYWWARYGSPDGVTVVLDDSGSNTNNEASLPEEPTWTLAAEQPDDECTATTSNTDQVAYEADYGNGYELPSPPIPYDQEFVEGTFATSATKTEGYFKNLASSVNKGAVIARATAKIPAEWPDPPAEDAACNSSVITDWPKVSDIGTWPACGSGPPSAVGSATVTKARYRIGIPEGDGYAGFDAAHAAWVTAGSLPPEPIERSYYEAQWDEVFFPAEWEAWKVLKDAFDAATVIHDEWEAAGSEGDEPIIPPDPGEATGATPSLISARSWSYTGADEFSEWFEMEVPGAPGESRVVNMLTKHYQSIRLGNKPTAHGEIYEL